MAAALSFGSNTSFGSVTLRLARVAVTVGMSDSSNRSSSPKRRSVLNSGPVTRSSIGAFTGGPCS